MPLFEVDASRPFLVQSERSAGAAEPGLGTTAHRVVDSHIDGLLGEQIFPVAQGAGPDEPHLLALDATGSPVVVELVAELDRSQLTRALDHAGWAGRLTRGELAARYQGGPNAFQRDIAAFYDSVPITRSQPGRSSARLIVICQEAGEEILNAVDFLRQPTMPVEVLKMGVVHSQDGRRFVDVSPLVIHPSSGPATPHLAGAPAGSSAATPGAAPGVAEAAASPAADPDFAEGVKVGIALTGKHPAVVQPVGDSDASVAVGPGSTTRVRRPVPRTPNEARTPDDARTPNEARTSGDAGVERPTGERRRAGRRSAAGTPSLSMPTVPEADGGTSGTAPAPAVPVPATPAPATPRSPGRSDQPPPPPPPERPSETAGPAVRRRSRSDRFTSRPQPSPELAAFTAASASSAAEDLDLAELARRTTSAASTDTPGLGEDFARITGPALDLLPGPATSRRGVPARRREPAPWDPPEARWSDPLSDPLTDPAPRGGFGSWEPSTPSTWTSASDDLPRLEVPPLEAPSYTPPPDRDLYDAADGATSVLLQDEIDGDLIALAATLRRPVALVWSRPRRRQHFEAVLHQDGVIELADGSRFQHPDHAASAACGHRTDDGWNVWRIGEEGRTLLEAYRARFA